MIDLDDIGYDAVYEYKSSFEMIMDIISGLVVHETWVSQHRSNSNSSMVMPIAFNFFFQKEAFNSKLFCVFLIFDICNDLDIKKLNLNGCAVHFGIQFV